MPDIHHHSNIIFQVQMSLSFSNFQFSLSNLQGQLSLKPQAEYRVSLLILKTKHLESHTLSS